MRLLYLMLTLMVSVVASRHYQQVAEESLLRSTDQSPTLNENCKNEFPLRETLEILEAIAQKYGTQKEEIDENGDKWTSILLVDETEVEINNTKFRLNTAENSPTTFYFQVLQLYNEAIYVVPKDVAKHWSAKHPDNTYLLHKISFDCAKDEVACGFKCCSGRTQTIQQAFLETITEKRKRMRRAHRVLAYYNDYQIIRDGIEYSLEHKEGMNCRYRLSQFDRLYQKRASYNIMTDTIHYRCPVGTICCALACRKAAPTIEPEMAAIRMNSRSDVLETCVRFFKANEWTIYYCGLIIVSIFIFIVIVYHSRTLIRSQRKRPQPVSSIHRFQSNETQTSRVTLRDVESPLLARQHRPSPAPVKKFVVFSTEEPIVIPERPSELKSLMVSVSPSVSPTKEKNPLLTGEPAKLTVQVSASDAGQPPLQPSIPPIPSPRTKFFER